MRKFVLAFLFAGLILWFLGSVSALFAQTDNSKINNSKVGQDMRNVQKDPAGTFNGSLKRNEPQPVKAQPNSGKPKTAAEIAAEQNKRQREIDKANAGKIKLDKPRSNIDKLPGTKPSATSPAQAQQPKTPAQVPPVKTSTQTAPAKPAATVTPVKAAPPSTTVKTAPPPPPPPVRAAAPPPPAPVKAAPPPPPAKAPPPPPKK